MKFITMNKVVAYVFRTIAVMAAIVTLSSPSVYENGGTFWAMLAYFVGGGVGAYLAFKIAEHFDPTDPSEFDEDYDGED